MPQPTDVILVKLIAVAFILAGLFWATTRTNLKSGNALVDKWNKLHLLAFYLFAWYGIGFFTLGLMHTDLNPPLFALVLSGLTFTQYKRSKLKAE